jgi:hypothetical protein
MFESHAESAASSRDHRQKEAHRGDTADGRIRTARKAYETASADGWRVAGEALEGECADAVVTYSVCWLPPTYGDGAELAGISLL